MNMPACMHCQQPLEVHTPQPDGNSACLDGKNTFNFEFQISPEAAAFVKANLDKPSSELTQLWIDRVRQQNREKHAAVEAALQADAAKVRAKIMARTPPEPNLFDALESIGATMDPHWHGEWTGPILFNDPKGSSRLILVETGDHDAIAIWFAANPNFTDEALQDQGREALVRMCGRPIDSKDYV